MYGVIPHKRRKPITQACTFCQVGAHGACPMKCKEHGTTTED